MPVLIFVALLTFFSFIIGAWNQDSLEFDIDFYNKFPPRNEERIMEKLKHDLQFFRILKYSSLFIFVVTMLWICSQL